MKESAKGKCLYLSDTFTKSRTGVRSLDYGFRFGKNKLRLSVLMKLYFSLFLKRS